MNETQCLVDEVRQVLEYLQQADATGDHENGIAAAQQLQELGSQLAFVQSRRAALLEACG